MNKVSRRQVLAYLAASAPLSLFHHAAFAAPHSRAKRRPNIILILVENVGFGDVGCYGNRVACTPHLDRLAVGGARLTDFHACAPVADPARIGLYTGHYPQRYGVQAAMAANHRNPAWVLNAVTFAHILKSEGYTLDSCMDSAAARRLAQFSRESGNRPFCIQVVPEASSAAVADHVTGEVMAAVQSEGIEEDTFVVFCSLSATKSDRRLRGGKGTLWEGGHRLPAIAWWPGRIPGGVVIDEPTSSLDLFPTLMSMSGCRGPDAHALDGLNLLPCLLHGDSLGERVLFWSYSGSHAVRQGAWKSVFNRGGGAKGLFLFDVSRDVQEERNLYEQDRQQVKMLESRYAAWEYASLC